MDERLREIMLQKIKVVRTDADRIDKLVRTLESNTVQREPFARGVVTGRLYNAFHYQCRRLFKRDPTEREFSEFLELIKERTRKI